MIGRRGLLKGAVGMAAAGKAAAQEVEKELMNAGFEAAGAVGTKVSTVDEVYFDWHSMRKLHEQFYREVEGIRLEIAPQHEEKRSWSPAFKRHIALQEAKSREAKFARFEEINNMTGGMAVKLIAMKKFLEEIK